MKIAPVLALSLGLLCTNLVWAQKNFDLVPLPVNLQQEQGVYQIPKIPNLYADEIFKPSIRLLSEHPAIEGIRIADKQNADILIIKKKNLKKGAYHLAINRKGIKITAGDGQGAIHGIYTLIQLGLLQKDPSKIGYVKIEDAPRFGYRGLHLDVSRHFFPLSFLKKYIDLMAIYKLNQFHWHLTDGPGWRLEIKQYPELTQKAAWRTHASWKKWWNHGRRYVEEGTPNASGGYYTQEQAKELVAYAAARGINIIPEIEMPGHSEEVLAVYPQLACSGKPYTQSEFCVGNPEVFTFLENVLDEVMAIFPSEYIHIGGDEANKEHWKTCPKCQALMKREGFTSVDQLQSYFIKKIDQYVQSKGRKIIGWDEIMQGGLSEGATVMSWRGEEGGIKAAKMRHDVIMTPAEFLYFDAYQSDPRTEPEANGGYLPIEKVYSYNPVSKELSREEAKYILGAQANVWCEYIPTVEDVEYMVYPRVLALAEIDWTPQQQRNYADFHQRLQSQYRVLQRLGVHYFRPSYGVLAQVQYHADSNTNTVKLVTEQQDASHIHYTLDGSEPTAESPTYTQPLKFTKSGVIKAAYFFDGVAMGNVLTQHIDLHKAIGKKVIYNQKWIGYPAQKEKTLTNGIFGGLSYHDGQWQGFTRPMDVVVDMGKPTEINSVAMNFMQVTAPGVYMPGEMRVFISDDGKKYTEVGVVKNDVPMSQAKLTFKRFELHLKNPEKARYLRVTTTNPGHGYQFTDEIIVY